MSIYEAVLELVGVVPSGLEPVVYLFSCVLLLWLLTSAFGLLGSLFNYLAGKG